MSQPGATWQHRLFRQRRGNLAWDGVVRGTGLVAVAAIPVLIWFPPRVSGLVAFLIVTIWVNGPLGIFLPATYEPILMLFGRIYPPVLIGTIGIIGTLYIEGLNYYLYAKILHLKAFTPARESAMVKRVVGWFRRAPFFTVWMCSWSPFPYWTVRILAPIAGYPLRKYLLATLLGRFPRLWFFAALGLLWGVSPQVLLAISLGSIALAGSVFGYKAVKKRPASLEPSGS